MSNASDLAFPALDRTQTPNETTQLGLNKRELFAAMAMQGLMADDRYAGRAYEAMARDAVRASDALLAVLAK